MRKIIFLIKLFIIHCSLFIVQFAYSQDAKPDARLFAIGLEAIPSLAWLKPNSSGFSGNGDKLGFTYGLMLDFFFTENYGIETGANIAYTGGDLKYNVTPVAADSKFQSQYIEIPVVLKMKTKEYGYVSYYAQFGFSAAVRISAKEDWNYINSVTPQDNGSNNNEDITNQLNFLKASFIIGGGIEYSLRGTTRLLCGIIFDNGLSHFLNTNNNTISSGNFGSSNSINNSLGLTVGILF